MSKAAIHAIQTAVISDSGLGCHLLAALMKVSMVLSRSACCDAGSFSICSICRRIFRLGFLPRAAFVPARPSSSSVETSSASPKWTAISPFNNQISPAFKS